MNPTDILLSIAIVGIYTQIYIYLKTNYTKFTHLPATTIPSINMVGELVAYLNSKSFAKVIF